MAIRGGKKYCASSEPCRNENYCDTPSSKIFYDGEDIEEAGVKHGMPLNTVIANIASYMKRAIRVSGVIKKQNFEGTSRVILDSDPAEVLQVTYCGGVLPPEMYKSEGRNIKFCKDLCKDNEFASVQVIYREKSDSAYGFRC